MEFDTIKGIVQTLKHDLGPPLIISGIENSPKLEHIRQQQDRT